MIRLQPLPYPYGGLAPAMSEATLRLHHDKHHARYVAAVNELVDAAELGLSQAPLEAILRQARTQGHTRLLANAGQAWNHGFFWRSLTPDAAAPGRAMRLAMDAAGGIEAVGRRFIEAGGGHFGSGWAWLVVEEGALGVRMTHDGETLAETDATPLLVCDLWEHAYYLDYQNDRAAFLRVFWDRLADWRFAETQLAAAQAGTAPWEYRETVGDNAAVALEDAIAAADWHLTRPPQRSLDVALRRKLAEELEQRVAAPTEPASFARQSDDLERRIRRLSEQLRQAPPEGQHWPILPAF